MGKSRSKRSHRRRSDKNNKDEHKEEVEKNVDTQDQTAQDIDMVDNNNMDQDQDQHQQRPSAIDTMFNPQHFQAAHYGEVSEEMLGYFKNVEEKLNDQDFESAEGINILINTYIH